MKTASFNNYTLKYNAPHNLYASLKPSHRNIFWSDENGVTAIEFALIAPILLLLIMAITEISMIMYAQSIMESAAFSASRTGKTGYIASNFSREQTILNELNHRASSLLDSSKITINTTTYGQFSEIGQPEPFVDVNGNGKRDAGENYTDVNGNGQYDNDMGISGAGGGSQVVVYTINYPWPVFTPLIGALIGVQDHINISARAVVQNEPF